jgi:hypothetical protein
MEYPQYNERLQYIGIRESRMGLWHGMTRRLISGRFSCGQRGHFVGLSERFDTAEYYFVVCPVMI